MSKLLLSVFVFLAAWSPFASPAEASFDAYSSGAPAGAVSAETPTPALSAPQVYPIGSLLSQVRSVGVGDVNGDGRNDVVATTTQYNDPANDLKLFVFPQLSDGTLGSPVKYDTHGVYGDLLGLDVGDFTGDGRQDVAVATGRGIDLFIQLSTGTLRAPILLATPYATAEVEIADVDGDSRRDLVVSGVPRVFVFFNKPGGVVRKAISTQQLGDLNVADVTGDGRQDVVGCPGYAGTCPGLTVIVLAQQADGSFVSRNYSGQVETLHGGGVGAGDVNDDGRTDVIATVEASTPDAAMEAFLQQADGTLATPVKYLAAHVPETAAAADLNQDGRDDALTLHGDSLGLFLQGPTGSLERECHYSFPNVSSHYPDSLAVGDINSDGLKDVVIGDDYRGVVVLRQQTPGQGVTSLTLTALSPVVLGYPVQLSGVLSFPNGGCSRDSDVIHITRRNPDGSSTALPDVPVAANGTYAFTDAPTAAGDYKYQASWDGDGVHVQASADRPVTIDRKTTTLGLFFNPSNRVVDPGGRVVVTAHLGAWDTNNIVSIYKTPYGGAKTLLGTGAVNSSGNFTVTTRIAQSTTFTAEWSGDAVYKATSAQAVVSVRSTITGTLGGYYDTSGDGYRQYHYTSACGSSGTGCPEYAITLSPARPNGYVLVTVERFGGSFWNIEQQVSIQLGSDSSTIYKFQYSSSSVLNVSYRISASFYGDGGQLGDQTDDYGYFRVTT
jgi:hypothetical protein